MGQIERGRRSVDDIARYTALEGRRVLDVGCQTGALAIALSERGANVSGMDLESKLIEAATIRARCHGARAEFRVAFAESLPFESASFDVVTFIDVIEHVRDAAKALGEIARVLRPGGVVYLQGPNRFSPRWFARDPHYRMAGISVLPPALGAFYVTRVRRRPRYDVGVFPIGSRVVRTLEKNGLEVIASPYDPRGTITNRVRGAIALRFASMFTLVARKR
jgi:2-polyprenyl-3-methyl-5-hydroxy-6-metoxy-1,4-benzoquinol methylase